MSDIQKLEEVCLENLEYLEDLKKINYENLKATYNTLIWRSKLLNDYYNDLNYEKMYLHEKLLYEASLPDYYDMTKIAFVCCLFFQQILVSEYTEDRYKAFMKILEESKLEPSKNFIVYLIQRLNMQDHFVAPPELSENLNYMQKLKFYNDTTYTIEYDREKFNNMFNIRGYFLSQTYLFFNADEKYYAYDNLFYNFIPENKKVIYPISLRGVADDLEIRHRNYLINRKIDGKNCWIRIDSHGASPNSVSLKFDEVMREFVENYISCNDYTYAPGPQTVVNAGFCIFMPLFIIRELIDDVPLEQVYKKIINPEWIVSELNTLLLDLNFSVTKNQ